MKMKETVANYETWNWQSYDYEEQKKIVKESHRYCNDDTCTDQPKMMSYPLRLCDDISN